ncbi:hypothetical protein EDC01DRAFT_673224 [Geopyxis carbonaria]|nr:hypothetical protein EDC01DRAFT_673224 [Geopyxis carbonaria]
MKSVYAIVFAAVAAIASAQLDDLPPCALTCLTGGLSETGCDLTDFACACSNDAFVSSSAECIQSSCDAASQQAALDGAVALCKSAGVDIPTTFPGGAESSTEAPSSSVAASTPAATSAAPTSEAYAAPTSDVSEAPVLTSTEVMPTVVPVPVPTGTGAAGNGSSNGTATSSLSPPVQTDNGAGRLSAAFSVVGLGMIAAFVL